MIALLALFALSVAAGAVNAVAGGGMFLVFPSLIASGVSPVVANATATAALWPGSAASALAYRSVWPARTPALTWFIAASMAGALAGSLVLLLCPPTAFARAVPYLMLGASVAYTFGPYVTTRIRKLRNSSPGTVDAAETKGRSLAVGVIVQFAIGVYGGYFGAGMGILMLAGMSLLGMGNLHAMNAIRTVVSILINAVAIVAFLVAGAVALRQAALLSVGAIVGGYVGAALARKVDPKRVRYLVIALAWTMTVLMAVHGRASR